MAEKVVCERRGTSVLMPMVLEKDVYCPTSSYRQDGQVFRNIWSIHWSPPKHHGWMWNHYWNLQRLVCFLWTFWVWMTFISFQLLSVYCSEIYSSTLDGIFLCTLFLGNGSGMEFGQWDCPLCLAFEKYWRTLPQATERYIHFVNINNLDTSLCK